MNIHETLLMLIKQDQSIVPALLNFNFPILPSKHTVSVIQGDQYGTVAIDAYTHTNDFVINTGLDPNGWDPRITIRTTKTQLEVMINLVKSNKLQLLINFL